MKLTVQGSAQGLEVSDRNFAAPFNEAVVHQVVTAYRAAGRAGTKAQKTRAEVRGGGIKPWRQKGTGRARAGTIRGPIWVGGGRAFAAKPRDFGQKVNRKMYRAAMRSVLSELLRQERLVVVPGIELDQPKTKDLVARLKEQFKESAPGKVLILVDRLEEKLRLAARNLAWVEIAELNAINPVALIGHDRVLATPGVIRGLEERLS